MDDKTQPFAALDGRKSSLVDGEQVVAVTSLQDADEALAFLENHPRAAEIAQQGTAILEDDVQRRKLVRKIDFIIVPLLASVYFLQYLDKTTLSYAAVMGLRTDTHLKGQQYSDLSMLFYIGFITSEFPTQYFAQRFSRLSLYLGVNVCPATTPSFTMTTADSLRRSCYGASSWPATPLAPALPALPSAARSSAFSRHAWLPSWS